MTSRPTDVFVRSALIPQLVAALDARHADIVDSACIALGKAGGAAEVRVLTKMINHRSASVRKAAVIGLGLLEADAAIDPLIAVLEAAHDGRRLRGGKTPEADLRALATTSLGLTQRRSDRARPAAVGHRVRDVLLRFSKDDGNRNIQTSATVALGLLRGDESFLAPIEDHLRALVRSIRQADFVRAHALVGLARLLRQNGVEPQADTIDFVHKQLRDRSSHVHRSAVIALGILLENRGDAAAESVRRLTRRLAGDARGGNVVRFWSAISLGQIGGDKASYALRSVCLSEKNQRAAFAALGLGILAANLPERSDDTAVQKRWVRATRALRAAFKRMSNPAIRSGVAIGIGIARDETAGPLLLDAMKRARDVDHRSYLAVALGMIQYAPSAEYLGAVLDASDSLPFLKEQTAIGLGLLGDRRTGRRLVRELAGARSAYVQASATKALGYIGDRHSIEPLAAILSDDRRQALTRAFACVALGSIADDHDVPLLSALFANYNYLAATRSLLELSRIL